MHVSVSREPPARSGRTGLGVVYEAVIASSRDPGRTYTVRQKADGTWWCECRGFEYGARWDKMCRHIDQAREGQSGPVSLALLLAGRL